MIDTDLCLDDDELLAMAEGRLETARIDAVIDHIDGCDSCREVVATLVHFDPSQVETVREAIQPGGSPAPPPRRVGRYQIAGPLGAGGMGVVYRARDPELDRDVAIKLVRPERVDDVSRELLLREARSLARINHPNVVTIHDVGEHRGEIFIATELVEGQTLAQWSRGKSAREILEAWSQAARGLAAAHRQGVLHRDVKPSNVLVGADGRVRIGDFGLAKSGGSETAPPGAPASPALAVTESHLGGTPAYMAPEHVIGIADERSDQFSLCVAIAETLTGSRPGAGQVPAVGSAAVARILARGLSASPDARYPTVAALVDALAATLRPRRRGPWLIAGLAGLAAAIGAAALWLASQREACAVVEPDPGLWTAERRAWVETQIAPGVASRIDAMLATWSAASADVCTTDRASLAMQEQRRRCLDRQLDAIRERLAGWEPEPPDPLVALAALDVADRPIACSHGALAAAPDPTPEQAEAIAAIRAGLPRDPDARALAALVERARRVGHPPFVVEALETLASLQARTDRAAAARTLRAAVEAAGSYRFTRLRASINLLSALGADAVDEASAIAEQARAEIAALGGDPALEAELDAHLADAWLARRNYEQAIAGFERSRRGFRAAYGAGDYREAMALNALSGAHLGRDGASAEGRELRRQAHAMFDTAGVPMPLGGDATDPDRVIEATRELLEQARTHGHADDTTTEFYAEYNLGLAYIIKDQPETALLHLLRVIELGDSLGARESRLVDALSHVAGIHGDRGRRDEAIRYARRAVSLGEELGGDEALGTALTTLGAALIDGGRASDAVEPLERALAIRRDIGDNGRFIGNTRYQLARALGASDPARARKLATAAQVDIEGDLGSVDPDTAAGAHVLAGQRQRLAEIAAFLASLDK